MLPLYKILEGDSQLASPRQLTPEADAVLQKVEACLKSNQMQRCDLSWPIEILVFMEQAYPFAVIWQGGPLLFVYPHSHLPRVLYTQGAATADLILIAVKRTMEMSGKYPKRCIVPFNKEAVETWTKEIWEWAYIVLTLQIEIDNHYPTHPFFTFCMNVPIVQTQKVRKRPIEGAPTVFTDGAKGGTGAAVLGDQ